MYQISKEKMLCDKCGRAMPAKEIAIHFENKYLCRFCYRAADHGGHKYKGTTFAELAGDSFKIPEFFTVRTEFEQKEEKVESTKKSGITPKEIVKFLDRNIVGQEEAKKALAVAIYNHYRRVKGASDSSKVPKSNILMQGPTGSGKTFLLKNLAKLLDVPFYIADASVFTEAGYRGNDMECALTGLYQAAGCDISKAEKGIVYLDEFDKLCAGIGRRNVDMLSVGEGVQRQLLKMLEGSVMDIPKSGTQKKGDTISINTENILFICGGAFAGIGTETIRKETNAIGFVTTETKAETVAHEEQKEKRLTTADFVNYGMIPEVVGRLPIIVTLKGLEETDLVNILKNTESSLIKQYQAMLQADEVVLEFEEDAIQEIAHAAYVRKIGARGLSAIVDEIMQGLLYEIPSDPTITRCVITRDVVLGNVPAIMERVVTDEVEQALQQAS